MRISFKVLGFELASVELQSLDGLIVSGEVPAVAAAVTKSQAFSRWTKGISRVWVKGMMA